jgi:hypothetical protein
MTINSKTNLKKRRKITKVQSRMDNPEKLATLDTQGTKRRQTKQKHNTTCVGHHYAHTNTIRHELSYKQLKVKTNRTSFLCGNRNRKTDRK